MLSNYTYSPRRGLETALPAVCTDTVLSLEKFTPKGVVALGR